jgi:hypothetical protein
MAMQRIDLSDNSDDFETIIGSDGRKKKVLRDRHAFRVPMRFADAAHQPGFVRVSDASAITDAKAEAAKAYDAYDARLTTAWKDAPPVPPTGFGSRAFLGAQAGDLCTCRGLEFPDDFGAPGHLQARNGVLVCCPDNPKTQAAPQQPQSDKRNQRVDHAGTTDAAYADYDRDLQDAWKSPS